MRTDQSYQGEHVSLSANSSDDRVILVDMDGVLVDMDGWVYEQWRLQHPDRPLVPFVMRKEFYISLDHPLSYRDDLNRIMSDPALFYDACPIPGGLECVKEMAKTNEVLICTSPMLHNSKCMPGKFAWIERHLGPNWVNRIVITKDKTAVRGDYLIDDRPEVRGLFKPSWGHLIFRQPYNKNLGLTFTWEDISRRFCA